MDKATPPRSDLPEPRAGLLAGKALLLDFDGTLVELVDRPDLVRVDPALSDLMAALARRLGGRLAVLSGRPADQIAALFGSPQGFTVGGSHGLEVHWADGRRDRPEAAPALAVVDTAFQALADAHPGALVERKPFGVALHYRAVPGLEAEASALAARLAGETGLHLQPGKMMVELRMTGADKGSALRAIAGGPEMAGAAPVFVGDDLTDEPAFVAARALGGAGVLVGPPRETAAAFRLPDVAAARLWLGAEAAA